MSDPERPELPLHIDASIEAAQNHVDEMFWLQLCDFQTAPHSNSGQFSSSPPQSKRPAMLKMVLAEYAHNLYLAEGNLYPDGPRIGRWLEGLRDRLVERAMSTVARMEESGKWRNVSFEYHGVSPEQMRETMRSRIDQQIRARIGPAQPIEPLPPERPNAESDGSEVERRAILLSTFKAATGNPSNKSIYEASNSGIYKPEFYDWVNGKLPSASRITKRFEAFLKVKKRPIPKN